MENDMVWACADCLQSDEADSVSSRSVKVAAVCIHCGKALCDHHKFELAEDAFAEVSDALTADNEAMHCHECRRAYHPETLRFLETGSK
jgi:uncharacterized protein with PIN domain